MLPRAAALVAMALGAVVLGACMMEGPEGIESTGSDLSRAGRWTLPEDVREIGDEQDLEYDEAGAWNGGAGCSGELLEGTRQIGDWLEANFDGISEYGGYSCRQNTGNTSQLSVHGTGRALDLMIPTDGGAADNDAGDPIANWLVTHSEAVGVQFIIWDQTDWGAHRDPPKTSQYGGPNPHVDHIHMELTDEGAAMQTPWFLDDDHDGALGEDDNCPDLENVGQLDADGDGRGDACDVCPAVQDAGQQDSDGDAVGDACEDTDGDGVFDSIDLCPGAADPEQLDVDEDGVGDACDEHDDRPADEPAPEDPEDPEVEPGVDPREGEPGFERHDGPGPSGLTGGCAVAARGGGRTACLGLAAPLAALLLRGRRARPRPRAISESRTR